MALTKITPQMFDTSATAHDLNVDNGTFVVDGSASRVGIGTATPSTLLHVNGTATATTFVGALTGNVTGNVSGTAATVTGAAQTNITSLGTLTALTVDDITINGSTISDAAEFTLDIGGNINLDTDTGVIYLKDGGTVWGQINRATNDWEFYSPISDGDIVFKGNDGGSTITALKLDMSASGAATFNGNVAMGTSTVLDGLNIYASSNTNLRLHNGTTGASTSAGGIIQQAGDEMYVWNYEPSNLIFGTNNAERIRITNSGNVSFASTTAHAGNATFADNAKAIFGAGPELEMYSNGTIGYIDTAQLVIANAAHTNNIAKFIQAGAVELYHNNSLKLATTSAGIDVTGSVTANPSGGVITLGANGHITSKQSLDVVTAGGRYMGSSNRGLLGQMRIEQTAQGADGGYVALDTSAVGSTSPTERMRIDSSGKVGINEASPQNTLHVEGQTRLAKTSTNSHALNAATALEIRGDAIGNGVVDVDYFKGLKIALNDQTEWGGQAQFSVGRWEDSGNNSRSSLVISLGHGQINSGTNADVDVMTMRSNGSVGIGTTSPYYKLDVFGANLSNGAAKNLALFFDTTSATTGTGGGIAFGGYSNGTSGAINHLGNIQGIKENSTAGDYASAMVFSTRANGATPVEQMRIGSNGVLYVNGVSSLAARGSTASGTGSNGTELQVNGAIEMGYNGRYTACIWGPTTISSSAAYSHLKTNMWGGGSPHGNVDYIMGGFIITGYRYIGSTNGNLKEIHQFHNWSGTLYNYTGSNMLSSGNGWSGSGSVTISVYVGSDGFVYIRLPSDSTNYRMFMIDFIQYSQYNKINAEITAITVSSSATV